MFSIACGPIHRYWHQRMLFLVITDYVRVAFDKYIITITFLRETSPKSLPPQNKGSSQNIIWFLKTYYNHQLMRNIAANER